mgnify:CR=1 FL=1
MKENKKHRILAVLILIIIFFIGCKKTTHENISESINFEWGITEFRYYNINQKLELDLLNDERIFTLGFKNNKYLWFQKRNKNKYEFFNSKYEIIKNNDTLKLIISNSEDKRLNAIYDLYIDTLYEETKYHHIRLTLDSDNTFIVAEKMKSKPVDY